jgi:UDPglucose 6-dehydrogenase
MSNITVIGTGYVGLVTGACLSDFGLSVTCYDVDREKIGRLNKGEIPIFEEGLEPIVRKNSGNGRLTFSCDLARAVTSASVIFLAVGTPSLPDGSADLSYLEQALRDLAGHLDGYQVIVSKSTVPIGTTRRIREKLAAFCREAGREATFDVIANPEFLREGSAVYDFMHPDRVILGFDAPRALAVMKDVYRVLYLNETPFIETDFETAETIKYASNAFLAVKISYINQVADFCEAVGADVACVAKAMGRDGRIGAKFLHPGPGYGGSCFPKDVRAFIRTGKEHQTRLTILEEIDAFNENRKIRMTERIVSALGGVRGRTIAVLGLAFKPNTDDMRESPALTVVRRLAEQGALIRAFDPAALAEARTKYFADLSASVTYHADEYETAGRADALVILTEWNQFRNLDLNRLKTAMAGRQFFDLRNIYSKANVEALGFEYHGVGIAPKRS